MLFNHCGPPAAIYEKHVHSMFMDRGKTKQGPAGQRRGYGLFIKRSQPVRLLLGDVESLCKTR